MSNKSKKKGISPPSYFIILYRCMFKISRECQQCMPIWWWSLIFTDFDLTDVLPYMRIFDIFLILF